MSAGTVGPSRWARAADWARRDAAGLVRVDKLYITNAYFAPDSNFVRLLVSGPLTEVRAARGVARVYEFQPSTLHAKTFVVDGRWVSIGTMNFVDRALSLNDEATLVVLDTVTGRAMEQVFFDDLRHAKEIDLAEFRARPWRERAAEWMANQITRLL